MHQQRQQQAQLLLKHIILHLSQENFAHKHNIRLVVYCCHGRCCSWSWWHFRCALSLSLSLPLPLSLFRARATYECFSCTKMLAYLKTSENNMNYKFNDGAAFCFACIMLRNDEAMSARPGMCVGQTFAICSSRRFLVNWSRHQLCSNAPAFI